MLTDTQRNGLLVLLFIAAAYVSAGDATHAVRVLWNGATTPDAYFPVRVATREFGAKPYRLWQVLTIDGKPFTRGDQVRQAIKARRPGDQIPVRLKDQQGAVWQVNIPVRSAIPHGRRTADIIVAVAISLFLPIFCFVVAFVVAGIRPYDPRAWLLMALLVSFGETAGGFGWDWPLRAPAMLWHFAVRDLWPVWMMLFGLYFPKRSQIDVKWPWLKWILIVLVAGSSAVMDAMEFTWTYNIDASLPLRRFAEAALTVQSISAMVAISIFFIGLGASSGASQDRDARRRLSLIWIGASISLTPIFLISLYGLVRGRDMFTGLPQWAILSALLLLPFFPLTLAYVIVVQRAMKLRMVIRLGLQYALARGGVRILQIAVISVVVTLIVNGVRHDMRTPDQVWIIMMGVVAIGVQRRLTLRASEFIDRKFFREAYSTDRILMELSEQARRFTETRPLLETVTERVASTLHIPRAAVLLRDGDNYCLAKTVVGFDPAVRCLPLQARAIEHMRKERRPALVYFDDKKSWVNLIEPEEKRRLQALDAQVLVALSGREELVGVMVLGPKQSEEPYSRNDLRLLETVGSQTGLALENTELLAKLSAEAAQRERINRELEIAREVQERLFPQEYPPVPGVDYCGFCRPAQGIGGDYYDFIQHECGKLGIAIGDVSGKGVSAALLMSNLHASLRGQTMAQVADLSTLMSNINLLMYEASTSNRYATFFYGEYDPQSRVLQYVNAGHNAPMVVRGAECILLETGGPVVGLLKGVRYENGCCRLQPGDILVGFTDGVSEAMTAEDEEWGEERLLKTVRVSRERPAREMIDFILGQADAFTAGAAQFDDMTLSITKVF